MPKRCNSISNMELLSPAGSWESMVAAVFAGANAVYLGAGEFNARRRAVNFELDTASPRSLAAAVAFCHIRGVQVHLALNTLVRDRELPAALEIARAAAAAGVDALIVQDRGLARLIKAACPTLPLHASTQLTCHTPAGVDRLRQDGFSRVVLAREMTGDEIAACVGRGCETEVFVHGALCMCVSGQCELSAFLGGRSGNRGLCAQPCRLPFAAGHFPRDEAALSLKDNSLYPHLAELAALGVDSLKIEGRMKRPEYVAAATAVFRRALDGEPADEQMQSDLQAVFSRHGFTDGYFTGKRGAHMFGTRRYKDVQAADGAVLARLSRLYEKEPARVAVAMTLTVAANTPATLTVRDGERTVTVTGAIPEAARTRPLSAERATEQLQKTGGTPYRAAVTCDMEEGLTLPAAALNALRRDGLEALSALRGAPRSHPFCDPSLPAGGMPRGVLRGLVARVANLSQVRGEANLWVVPLGQAPEGVPFGVEIPRGMFGREDEIREGLTRAKEAGAAFALCPTVGALPLAAEAGLPAVAGWSMHIANAHALAAARDSGAVAAVASVELSLPQLAFAKEGGCGLFAYGRQPLMLMRNCPIGDCAACGGSLTDRKGVTFPVACGGGCSELLNSVPLYLADRLEELREFAFLYLHFTDETPQRVEEVLEEYRHGGQPPAAFTRGLYDKGTTDTPNDR